MLPIMVALVVWATPSFAQQLVCHPIRRGESAADVARRVTGSSRNAYLTSFQIMNAASRFVPKSQYERIHAGWRACVIRPAVHRDSSIARRPLASKASNVVDVAPEPDAPVAPPEPASFAATNAPPLIRIGTPAPTSIPHGGPLADFTMVWLGVAVAAPFFWLQGVDVYRSRTSARSALIEHFAHRFISEFERPLVQYDGTDRPLQSRVRRARGGRFAILLAPGVGRRYPNLTDHKRNVEYDVARVMDVLGDDAFVSGDLSISAEWVVVPFQPRPRPNQPKVT